MMLEYLEQMKEIGKALSTAIGEGDVDRVINLLKRRMELAERMGHPDPADPDVASGKVAEMLKEIVTMDGALEEKLRGLAGKLQNAIQAVQGEKQVVKGYITHSGEPGDPKFLDKEG